MTTLTVGRQPEAAGLPPDASPIMGGTLTGDLTRAFYIAELAAKWLPAKDAAAVADYYDQALTANHGPDWYARPEAQAFLRHKEATHD